MSVPESVLLERLQKRINNPYGKSPTEIDKIIDDLHQIEPLLRKSSTYEIKTDKPLPEVIEEIKQLI